MNIGTAPALFNLPILCNFESTLSIYEATGLNFMNEKKTRVISAWVHPEESEYYFIWYVDQKSSTHWIALQDSRGSSLRIMNHHPLDHWKSFVEHSGFSDKSIRQGTTAVSRSFITYFTFNPHQDKYDASR
jgi:hypothetical protein